MPRKKRFFETGFRLKKAEKDALRAQGFHVYDRRDNGKDSTIEPSVAVDFLGTLVTNFPIRFPKKGPNAFTVWKGDAYLKACNAERVYRVDELKGKRRKGGKR
ncbi:MAG: hypothetical protein IJS52_03035 [Bacilli bacterium]|nr:hypothetical protein [Bacilli bacterium]